MRILFVSQEVPPQTGWGGIGTYIDVISTALAAKGHDVHVLSVADRQAAHRSRREDGVTVHRFNLPAVHRPSHYAPEIWRRLLVSVTVARLLGRLRLAPDVVECPEWMAEGLVLALRGELPLVVRLHSSARQLFRYTGQGTSLAGLDARVSYALEEISARRANVVVSTRSNLDEVADRIGLDPAALHAIPYPVRLPPPSPMPATTSPRIVFVGRLETRKGPDILLHAAPQVLEAIPDARFVFVGRDVGAPGVKPSSAWIRHEAEVLGIGDALELRGQLDREGVEDELRRASVCAFPSRWESFGNVVAEASAVGRPVVVSPIPPFQELVEDGVTGRTASLEDPGEWAAALIDLLTDPARAAAMGRAGAEHVSRISEPGHVAELALAAHRHARERFQRGQGAGRR